MGFLNYTTKIDPDKTAQEIAKCLSMHGAGAVLTEYDPRTLTCQLSRSRLNWASRRWASGCRAIGSSAHYYYEGQGKTVG
jgi:hypothetical protein